MNIELIKAGKETVVVCDEMDGDKKILKIYNFTFQYF